MMHKQGYLDMVCILVDKHVDIPVDKCVDILWKTTLPPPGSLARTWVPNSNFC